METKSIFKQRIEWIDYAKAIGIFLVIVGHGYSPTEGFDLFSKNFINAFHMPLFFFISGFLFRIKEEGGLVFLKNSAKSLLVPYILLNVIAGIIITPPIVYSQGMKGLYERFIDFLLGGAHSFAGASWFLIALFWVRIIAYFSVKYNITMLISILAIVVSYLTLKPCYFDLTSAAASFPFFILGFQIKKHQLHIYVERFKYRIMITSFIILTISVHYQGNVAIYNLSFGNYPYFYYLEAFIGIVFFVSMCMCIAKRHSTIISNISRGSIILMCLHGSIYIYLYIVVSKILSVNNSSFIYSIILSTITMIILYYPMRMIQKKYPIITGGR